MHQGVLFEMPLPPESKFAESLINQFVEARKLKGFTQSQIDQKIGVADGLVAKWEAGIRRPTLFNAFCWAESLGVKLNLLGDNEDGS